MNSDIMDNYPALLPQVTDESLSEKVQNLVKPILTDDMKINLDWLEDRGWIAVPAIYSIIEEDATQIAQTIRGANYDQCYAVWMRNNQPVNVFQVPISGAGIVAFGGESHVYPMIMIPLDLTFAVFSMGDPEYHVIAGSSNFVLNCLRFSIDETRKRFEIESSLEDDIRGRLMQDILEHYGQYLKS